MKILMSVPDLPRLSNCSCNGTCPGYGTRRDCPPLIVLAIAALTAGPGPNETSMQA